jgi:hypothetical protein
MIRPQRDKDPGMTANITAVHKIEMRLSHFEKTFDRTKQHIDDPRPAASYGSSAKLSQEILHRNLRIKVRARR